MAETTLRFALFMCGLGFVAWALGNTTVRFVKMKPGGEVAITCSTTLKGQEGLTLYRSLLVPEEVLYHNSAPPQLTIFPTFQGRVTTVGDFAALSVTISNLTTNDSGLYWCQYNKYNRRTYQLDESQGEGPVTVVHITDPPICDNLAITAPPTGPPAGPPTGLTLNNGCPPDDTMVWVLTGVSVSSVLLACVLLVICVIPKVKRFHEKKGQLNDDHRTRNTVYEEMRPKLLQ